MHMQAVAHAYKGVAGCESSSSSLWNSQPGRAQLDTDPAGWDVLQQLTPADQKTLAMLQAAQKALTEINQPVGIYIAKVPHMRLLSHTAL